MTNGLEFQLLLVCWCELDSWNGNDSYKRVSYLISIGEGEELGEVEDDGHQEEGEGVAQASLRAQAELKAMDCLLKIRNWMWRRLGLAIYLSCVESWTGEDLLASDAFFYPLLYIRPGDNQMVLEAILGLCVHLLLYW